MSPTAITERIMLGVTSLLTIFTQVKLWLFLFRHIRQILIFSVCPARHLPPIPPSGLVFEGGGRVHEHVHLLRHAQVKKKVSKTSFPLNKL